MRSLGVLLVIVLAAAASCADRGPETTATAEQALAEVRDALRGAEEVVGVPVSSDLPGGPLQTDCSDPVDGGPLGRIYWAAYYGTGLPAGKLLPSLDVLVPRMQGLGWMVRSDRRFEPGDSRVVFARPSAVDLTISFAGTPIDGYDVTATTACVWPNGVRP